MNKKLYGIKCKSTTDTETNFALKFMTDSYEEVTKRTGDLNLAVAGTPWIYSVSVFEVNPWCI